MVFFEESLAFGREAVFLQSTVGFVGEGSLNYFRL